MSFWTLRWASYREARTEAGARKVLAWDVGRVFVWGAFFAFGLFAHEKFVDILHLDSAMKFMVAICTFGTFLASFVLSVMSTTGKRELDLVISAEQANLMKERLTWLLSDQLIMVVSALSTVACGLIWIGCEAIAVAPPMPLTALALAFAGLALFNAMRLPFQIWELQSSALTEERLRAIERLNKENEDRFGE